MPVICNQTKQQMSDNLSMASKMSNAQNVADLMSNPALVGAKAIFDDLASTDWDNLELARYLQCNCNVL